MQSPLEEEEGVGVGVAVGVGVGVDVDVQSGVVNLQFDPLQQINVLLKHARIP